MFFCLQVRQLAAIGGNNIKECVIRIINCLLSNEMQQKTNRTGVGNAAIKFSDHLEPLVIGKKYEDLLRCTHCTYVVVIHMCIPFAQLLFVVYWLKILRHAQWKSVLETFFGVLKIAQEVANTDCYTLWIMYKCRQKRHIYFQWTTVTFTMIVIFLIAQLNKLYYYLCIDTILFHYFVLYGI